MKKSFTTSDLAQTTYVVFSEEEFIRKLFFLNLIF